MMSLPKLNVVIEFEKINSYKYNTADKRPTLIKSFSNFQNKKISRSKTHINKTTMKKYINCGYGHVNRKIYKRVDRHER